MSDNELDLNNGSNLIVTDSESRILIVREKTRKQLLMLPGGTVERGESPRHAAQSETEEESGIITDEADYCLVGVFVQKPKGVVFLYETNKWSGEISTAQSEDTSEAFFIKFEEILKRQEEFRTAYLRMILHYKRCKLGIQRIPYEGRLSDKVEFPRNLNGVKYTDIVLQV